MICGTCGQQLPDADDLWLDDYQHGLRDADDVVNRQADIDQASYLLGKRYGVAQAVAAIEALGENDD